MSITLKHNEFMYRLFKPLFKQQRYQKYKKIKYEHNNL